MAAKKKSVPSETVTTAPAPTGGITVSAEQVPIEMLHRYSSDKPIFRPTFTKEDFLGALKKVSRKKEQMPDTASE